jgi:hypothetical protein
MYDMYSQYYQDVCCSHAWVHPDKAECGCRGKGWWLSELDTWHQCPYHGKDVPHPEDEQQYDIEDRDQSNDNEYVRGTNQVEQPVVINPATWTDDDCIPF